MYLGDSADECRRFGAHIELIMEACRKGIEALAGKRIAISGSSAQ
jgi:hypothetical protein